MPQWDSLALAPASTLAFGTYCNLWTHWLFAHVLERALVFGTYCLLGLTGSFTLAPDNMALVLAQGSDSDLLHSALLVGGSVVLASNQWLGLIMALGSGSFDHL